MVQKFTLLLIVYGGLSVAALILVGIGFAMARGRLEVIAMAVIAGALVLVHAAELVFLASLGQLWGGDGIDPLLVAGVALMLAAGVATVQLVRRRGGREMQFSGDTR